MYKTFIKRFKKHVIIITMLSVASIASYAQLAGGTYTIGATGNYATLKQAIAVLTANGLTVAEDGQVVLELQANYDPAAEFNGAAPNDNTPIIVAAFANASATNQVIIRPATGVSKAITANIANSGVVVLQGAQYLTIDGRSGGTGGIEDIGLTIINTSTIGGTSFPTFTATVKLTDKAINNVVTYTNIRGSVNSQFYGAVVLIGGGTPNLVGLSSNNNTISYNDISSGNEGLSYTLIYNWSNVSGLSNANTNNTIKGNRLHNFRNVGISLYNGTGAGWKIEENSIYSATSNGAQGILLSGSNPTGGAVTINNNYIGGTLPQCGGNSMTLGTSAFSAISTTALNMTSLTIRNNTISNITASTGGTTTGILIGAITAGTVDISGNNINNIRKPTGTSGQVNGITNNSTQGVRIFGNTIHTLSNDIPAIHVSAILSNAGVASTVDILNNHIYSISSVGSANGVSTTTAATHNIVNNTISLINYYSGTPGIGNVIGVKADGTGIHNIYYNTLQMDNGAAALPFGNHMIVVNNNGNADVRNNIFSNAITTATVNGPAAITDNLFISGSSATVTNYTNNTNAKYGDNIDDFGPAPTNSAELFDSPTILTIHPSYRPLIQTAGANIAGHTTDINGFVRHATTPSLGAYEYNLLLPVTINTFNAKLSNNKVYLNWGVGTETNVSHYEVERLQAGGAYVKVAQVAATGAASYIATDVQPLIGDNYYRLKSVDNDGTVGYYADLKNVKITALSDSKVSVYPNPVTDNMITISLSGYSAGKYTYKIIGVGGNVVAQGQFNNDSSTSTIALPPNLAKGVYVLQLNNKAEVIQTKILKY